MSSEHPNLTDVELPRDVAAEFRAATDRDGGSMTLLDGLDAVEELVSGADGRVSLEQFYQPDSTRHEVRIGERVEHVPCVLDALIVAERRRAEPVVVRSEPPGGRQTVSFDARSAEVGVTPEQAVVSFGLSADDTDDREMGSFSSMEAGSVVICSYINAFPDGGAYERWASSLSEGSVMMLSADTAIELAAEAAARWSFA